MLRTADIQAALLSIVPEPVHDGDIGYLTMYRASAARHYLATPQSVPLPVINCSYARMNNGQRFTSPGGPPTLYLSYQPTTALREVNYETWPEIKATLLFTVRVCLDSVLDLTVRANLNALGMTTEELRCYWQMLHLLKKPVPTQDLGDAVVASGRFQAIKYPSMRDPEGSNIAIYCDLVTDPSYIIVNDPSNLVAGRIP